MTRTDKGKKKDTERRGDYFVTGKEVR